MRIGIFGGDVAGGGGIDDVIAAAAEVEAQGFASFTLPQIFGLDALTTLALVGRTVPRIELATGVVPTYPRHPTALAQQALTVQAATGGRLMLGIGLSHQIVVESMWGLSFDKPLRHMRDYLSILLPLVREGSVSYDGPTLSTHAGIQVPGSTPCPVLVAALGPKMLELAGTVADGTITWMTGVRTLGDFTVPTITKAAAAAGRPAPRVGAGLPICVTADADAARDLAGRLFAVYNDLPSYRAMLDREGAAGPADVAIVGDEATVAAGLRRLADAGVTDLAAVEFGSPDERAANGALLRSLL